MARRDMTNHSNTHEVVVHYEKCVKTGVAVLEYNITNGKQIFSDVSDMITLKRTCNSFSNAILQSDHGILGIL